MNKKKEFSFFILSVFFLILLPSSSNSFSLSYSDSSSTDLKFQPQQKLKVEGKPLSNVVDNLLKIWQKSGPSDRNRIVQFIQNFKLSSENIFHSFQWSDCGNSSSIVIFKEINVSPDPIEMPGDFQVSAKVVVTEDIDAGLSGEVVLKRKMEFIDFEIPCVDNLGSCTYDDVCGLLTDIPRCPQVLVQNNIPCRCPFKKGTFTFPSTKFNIPTDPIPGGDYTLNLLLKLNNKFAGCLNLAASFSKV